MNMERTNPKFLKQIITTPETVIDQLDLVYVDENQLKIIRQKKENNFCYLLDNKLISNEKDIKRIQKLVIPPAWQKVKITTLENGHLQAVGRDLKNRKQYRYHSLWKTIRNQTKFYKMTDFGKQLPKIRKRVDLDLEQRGWPKSKVLALIIRLMEETHIRVGNEQYAKRNKTFGLSTMRTRHVSLENNKMKFDFIGKRGKKHSVTLRNKKLIRLVNQCEEIPGWELFQYYDINGDKHSVDSGMINHYIHQICGDLFTAKDFRTWAATSIFFETLKDLKIGNSDQKRQKNVLQAFDAAAKGLGNTRNVCRKYYVHPAIERAYLDGSIQKTFDNIDNYISSSVSYFSPSEQGILELIGSYTPAFLENIKN
ncbi:DNA topoisomerase-1 [Aquimarina spongiae]|uniref:DNA topoisomerase n=2 Tax=Aquimarina spongiae TaxID=570521 RepID=A0A1M6GMQ7_9FLAO|nr:DNA topoisomerase IB [Aquimarina spongiae]SHJ11200.1 DNA topoisomerase-1 [Aquimarina spongiae]